MVKFLGVIDLLSAIALFSIKGGVIHTEAFLLLIVFLFLKASICFFDIGGIIDILIAIIIILSFFLSIPPLILIIGSLIVGIKGIISVAS